MFLEKLTIPDPLQRLHDSGLVPGGTPLPSAMIHRTIAKKFPCNTDWAKDNYILEHFHKRELSKEKKTFGGEQIRHTTGFTRHCSLK